MVLEQYPTSPNGFPREVFENLNKQFIKHGDTSLFAAVKEYRKANQKSEEEREQKKMERAFAAVIPQLADALVPMLQNAVKEHMQYHEEPRGSLDTLSLMNSRVTFHEKSVIQKLDSVIEAIEKNSTQIQDFRKQVQEHFDSLTQERFDSLTQRIEAGLEKWRQESIVEGNKLRDTITTLTTNTESITEQGNKFLDTVNTMGTNMEKHLEILMTQVSEIEEVVEYVNNGVKAIRTDTERLTEEGSQMKQTIATGVQEVEKLTGNLQTTIDQLSNVKNLFDMMIKEAADLKAGNNTIIDGIVEAKEKISSNLKNSTVLLEVCGTLASKEDVLQQTEKISESLAPYMIDLNDKVTEHCSNGINEGILAFQQQTTAEISSIKDILQKTTSLTQEIKTFQENGLSEATKHTHLLSMELVALRDMLAQHTTTAAAISETTNELHRATQEQLDDLTTKLLVIEQSLESKFGSLTQAMQDGVITLKNHGVWKVCVLLNTIGILNQKLSGIVSTHAAEFGTEIKELKAILTEHGRVSSFDTRQIANAAKSLQTEVESLRQKAEADHLTVTNTLGMVAASAAKIDPVKDEIMSLRSVFDFLKQDVQTHSKVLLNCSTKIFSKLDNIFGLVRQARYMITTSLSRNATEFVATAVDMASACNSVILETDKQSKDITKSVDGLVTKHKELDEILQRLSTIIESDSMARNSNADAVHQSIKRLEDTVLKSVSEQNGSYNTQIGLLQDEMSAIRLQIGQSNDATKMAMENYERQHKTQIEEHSQVIEKSVQTRLGTISEELNGSISSNKHDIELMVQQLATRMNELVQKIPDDCSISPSIEELSHVIQKYSTDLSSLSEHVKGLQAQVDDFEGQLKTDMGSVIDIASDARENTRSLESIHKNIDFRLAVTIGSIGANSKRLDSLGAQLSSSFNELQATTNSIDYNMLELATGVEHLDSKYRVTANPIQQRTTNVLEVRQSTTDTQREHSAMVQMEDHMSGSSQPQPATDNPEPQRHTTDDTRREHSAIVQMEDHTSGSSQPQPAADNPEPQRHTTDVQRAGPSNTSKHPLQDAELGVRPSKTPRLETEIYIGERKKKGSITRELQDADISNFIRDKIKYHDGRGPAARKNNMEENRDRLTVCFLTKDRLRSDEKREDWVDETRECPNCTRLRKRENLKESICFVFTNMDRIKFFPQGPAEIQGQQILVD